MTLLLEIAIKTAALFLLAMLSLIVLRRRSAALRHCVLTAAFVCAIAVPTLTMLAPTWHLPVPASWLPGGTPGSLTFSSTAQPPAGTATAESDASHTMGPARGRITALQIAADVWLAGVVGFGAFVATGLWRVRRWGRNATPVVTGVWREYTDQIAAAYGIRMPIRLLRSTHPTMLVTWGLIHPRILLPAAAADWSDDRVRVVLCHELAHIKRGDWPVLIAASVLRAVHWFNPLVWIAHRRLRFESEQATDDLVLERGVGAADYASHLLAVARETVRHRHAWSAATAIAHPSTLEGRVRAMLNDRLNRTPLTAIGRWTAAIASLAITLAIASAGVSTLAAQADSRVTADSILVETPAAPASGTSIELRGNVTLVDGAKTITADRMRINLAATPSPAAAQVKPGTINGVLYDQLGGLLPGVKATLVKQPEGSRYETLTDRNGAFTFTLLPSGDYELMTSLPGFATVTNLVKVDAGATVERRITMPMGTLQETVHVTGPAGGPGRVISARPSNRPLPAPPESKTFFSGGIGGQIKAPTKIVHVNPIFPSEAGSASDVIKLTGRVGIDGFISDLREVTSPDAASNAHAAFVASALEATRQWEFTPVLLNNVPVEANINITVSYSVR